MSRSTHCSTSHGPTAAATHVMVHSHTGYTTNLPLEHVTGGQAWVVWDYDDAPLPVEHGGPGAA